VAHILAGIVPTIVLLFAGMFIIKEQHRNKVVRPTAMASPPEWFTPLGRFGAAGISADIEDAATPRPPGSALVARPQPPRPSPGQERTWP